MILTDCSTPEMRTGPAECSRPPPPPPPPAYESHVTVTGPPPPPLLPAYTLHPLPKLASGPIPTLPDVPPVLTNHWCSLEKPWS